ncbi:MAG: PRC-barrel domain-containing protein [Alcanivorax sp.]
MKTNVFLLAVIASFGLASFTHASADHHEGAVGLQKEIMSINRLKPLQNPRNERTANILDRHVLDSGSKVIGEVTDLVIDAKGAVRSVLVDFDRLRLASPVFLNSETLNIESVSSGYRLSLDEDEVEEIYPSLLSAVEAASGDQAKQFSVINLIGSEVITSDGYKIGHLDDILFDRDGKYVRSTYIVINYKTVHDKGLAVPLSVLNFEKMDGRTKIRIDQKYADLIIRHAEEG